MAGTVNRWRRKPRPDKGLRPCPRCDRMNGWLQRGANNVCAPGVGCRRDHVGGTFRGQ